MIIILEEFCMGSDELYGKMVEKLCWFSKLGKLLAAPSRLPVTQTLTISLRIHSFKSQSFRHAPVLTLTASKHLREARESGKHFAEKFQSYVKQREFYASVSTSFLNRLSE